MNVAALERVRQKLEVYTEVRALQLQETVVDLHENAPRGGRNLNANLEPRSAPGEQPATESETLLGLLREGPHKIPKGFRVAVNYRKLEDGFMAPEGRVRPRPMGAIASAEFREVVRRGKAL